MFKAKATFFCVGENVAKHPHLYKRIIDEGHSLGNHTQHHCNGWLTTTENYLQQVNECGKLVDSKIFRPPYGKITPLQAFSIKKNYQIVMWDVLSRDYDTQLLPEQCIDIVKKHASPGSIIVMHDSIKAMPRLQQLLPAILEFYTKQSIAFKTLPVH
ncbi:MAG: hypothetical protein RIQ89_761 [Bacteroidota bacterium]